MNKPLMKCGHVANSISNNKPACVICSCFEIDEEKSISQLLKNRKARCSYYSKNHGRNSGPIHGGGKCDSGICSCEVQSSLELPFFEYTGPGSKYEFANSHPSQGGTGNYLDSNKKMEHLCENNGKKFEPCVGGLEFDEFYCGCHGWD